MSLCKTLNLSTGLTPEISSADDCDVKGEGFHCFAPL